MDVLQNPDLIKEEFAKRKKKQFTLGIPVAVIFIATLIIRRSSDFNLFGITQDYVMFIGLAILGAYALFSFKNWRCPACDKYLAKQTNPSFCPNCGAKYK
jgi:hypothetical protein